MRYVLIDRITELLPGERAAGVKCVSLSDDVFADHFPGYPIMPGALLIEAMAQLGGVLLESTAARTDDGEMHALLTMIDRAKFRRMVRPGDRVELATHVIVAREDGGQVRATATVDGQTVAEAELGFAFARVTDPVLIARRREYLKVWRQT